MSVFPHSEDAGRWTTKFKVSLVYSQILSQGKQTKQPNKKNKRTQSTEETNYVKRQHVEVLQDINTDGYFRDGQRKESPKSKVQENKETSSQETFKKKKNLVLILNRKNKSEFGLKKRVEIFLAHNLVNGTLVRFYSMCMSAGLSMCTCTIYRPEEGTRSPRTVVADGYESLDVDAGTKTQVSFTREQIFLITSHLFSSRNANFEFMRLRVWNMVIMWPWLAWNSLSGPHCP